MLARPDIFGALCDSPPCLDHRRTVGLRPHGAPDGARIIRWIADNSMRSDDGLALLNGLCAILCEEHLPLWRVSVIIPALDPTIRALRFDWSRERGASLSSASHDDPGIAASFRHPVHALLSNGRTVARWRLDGGVDEATLPALGELRAEGGTDFVQYILWFTPGTALKGLSVSLATDRCEGFSDVDLTIFAEVLPTLGLAMSKFSLSRTLQETLAIYLGSVTAGRVLAGNIQRGQGSTVAAAIMLADFRAFTALTEREDPIDVVAWLDEHFDAVGEAVTRGGGEILKFTGDGFLAIFPVLEARGAAPTCGHALRAAEQAQTANRALNARRDLAGLPQLDVDLVLHYGDVVYGNVGTSRRLDFTVIGRAVNEASRIEELCDETGHAILLSDSFAERCPRRLTRVGTFMLRGLKREQEIWTSA